METIDWTYAISTLIIRFVGIFVVLGVLQIIMQITGRIFARLDIRDQRTSASRLTPEEAAAIAVALQLHRPSQHRK